jgi:hypothetical protein
MITDEMAADAFFPTQVTLRMYVRVSSLLDFLKTHQIHAAQGWEGI